MLKRILFAVTICIVTTTTAYAGMSEAVAAMKKGDYTTAFQELNSLALQGDAKAQFLLGLMYYQGKVITQDDTKAVEWFQKAADQGDVKAQAILGSMYEDGKRVTQDDAKALKWFQKAAAQGDAHAQNFLGMRYLDGKGVPQNSAKAAEWFKKAVDQGDAAAQLYLGVMYEGGLGIAKDLEKALQLYALSAKQNNENAKDNLVKLQEQYKCIKKSNTLLFGEALNCTDMEALRTASKQAGAKATREDTTHWYDTYDSSGLLEGTSELSIAYMNGKFAEAFYKYESEMDTHKVVEVRDLVVSKYGKPASSEGNPSLGPVTYTWKLKDGIKIVVERAWPDTTVYLKYIHPANYAAMQAEIKRQENAEENDKRSKQSKAF
jgi:uncharacterized protein